MGEVMRRYVWIVRVGFLLIAGGLGAVAVEARRSEEGGQGLESVAGVTGQRQAIEFEQDGDGRPRAFHTRLYMSCSDGDEEDVTWSPRDGAPVPFELSGNRLRVREEGAWEYDGGIAATGVTTMDARAGRPGVGGRMRAVWRFTRGGREYLVCDSGFVPFAVGPSASRRLERIPRSAEPWSLYPADAEPAAPRSWPHAGFLARVDRTCMRTWQLRPVDGGFEDYVRWHAGQWTALKRLGRPPDRRPAHARWLHNFKRRVLLEGVQLEALRRDDLDAAARAAAEVDALKAEGNLYGLRLGLVSCTSNGPSGAPAS